MFFATVDKIPTGEPSTMHLTLLLIVTEAETTTSSALETKIHRSMKMLAKTFANDDHCISVAANFPTITSVTIIDTLNYSWSKEGLGHKMGCLNKCLTLLNFWGPILTLQIICTTPAYTCHSLLHTESTSSIRISIAPN